MFTIPNSSAMDAAASGGGPSTQALPSIIGGSPTAILAHAAALTAKVAVFVGLLADLERARDELAEVWSDGSARDSVLEKLLRSFDSFQQIIRTLNSAIAELETSAAKLTIAQTAYSAVVNAVNPVVSALMSNPYTYGAAVALASGATGLLKAFIEAIGAVLNVIGSANIGQLISNLVSVITTIEQLFSKNNDAGSSTGATVSTAIANTPVTAPPPMASIATQAGQAALANGAITSYVPAALAGGQGGDYGMPAGYGGYGSAAGYGGYGMPAGYGAGYGPAGFGTDQWVAVNPGQSMPPTGAPVPAGEVSILPVESSTPADTAGADDNDVTITASKGDLTVTVEVPIDTGHAYDIDVSASSGGLSVDADVSVGADGSVRVS